MSYGTNFTVLIGRMTRDPETKYTRDNKMISSFTLAVSCGKEKEDTLFIDCSTFEKTAEVVQKYTVKGKQVCVTGRLKQDNWVDKDGNKKSKIKLNVSTVELLSDAKGETATSQAPNTQTRTGLPAQGKQTYQPQDFEPLGDDEVTF